MDQKIEEVDRCLETGALKQAEILIARLLRMGDSSAEWTAGVLLRRARVRLLSEKPDDALEDLEYCRKLQPELLDRPENLELAGDICFARFELAAVGFADRDNLDDALIHYNKVIDEIPDYGNLGWVLYQRGRIRLSQDRVTEAVGIFWQALDAPSIVSSLPALCYERLGFVELFENRDPEAALRFFAQAVDAYPAGQDIGWLVQLHILRSRALREQRRYTEALSTARLAFNTVDTSSADYRRMSAQAWLAVGEVLAHIAGCEEDAIDHLVQFLQMSVRPLGVDVTWSRVHETVGDLSSRLHRYEQAVSAYTEALVFNPYHPLITALYYKIARCHYHVGAYIHVVKTIRSMEQAAASDGEAIGDYRIYDTLAGAFFALKQYSEADKWYRRALALAPASAEHMSKIQLYLQLLEKRDNRR